VLKWLAVAEVAMRLKVSRVYAWTLIREGKLPAVRIGRGWMVSEVELERFMDCRARLRSEREIRLGPGRRLTGAGERGIVC
jgi:excisionase family DNA binding protein